MKKLLVVLMSLFVFTGLSLAQATTSTTTTQSTTKTTTKAHKAGAASKVTGTISQDGTSITDDADQKSWTISNPDKVKGHEGHKVIVTGKEDTANNSITVTSLKMQNATASGHKGSKKGASAPSPSGK